MPGIIREQLAHALVVQRRTSKESRMGKGILLWLIGVPIPVILVLWLLFHH
ncbi:hypothetical protein EDF56_102290 [Novosphingobium sp. PhB165]|uniref:hypothetical protein n=1 Tax=Novosphingobium sp. PhB165 TaxID=2485105 RepID=UPI0010D43A8C|nr:hypothetical protein [Novosphingobium sp. PhB165]TCM20628.1 hypothetical protein EDF56_102290 [Novosphingobium sp. PhB165]